MIYKIKSNNKIWNINKYKNYNNNKIQIIQRKLKKKTKILTILLKIIKNRSILLKINCIYNYKILYIVKIIYNNKLMIIKIKLDHQNKR